MYAVNHLDIKRHCIWIRIKSVSQYSIYIMNAPFQWHGAFMMVLNSSDDTVISVMTVNNEK